MLQRGVEASASPTIYTPLAQGEVDGTMTLLVSTGRPGRCGGTHRQIAPDIDPTQPPPTLTTMERMMSDAVAPRRFSFVLLGLFASLAALLAAILGEGMRLAVVGIVIGLGGSFLAARLLRQLVYQVSAYDPWTFSSAACLLAVIAFVACCVPAWRATRVDPMVALRGE